MDDLQEYFISAIDSATSTKWFWSMTKVEWVSMENATRFYPGDVEREIAYVRHYYMKDMYSFESEACYPLPWFCG